MNLNQLDEWQKEVLEAKGDICLCSGRQVGKSTIVSIKAAEFAAKNVKKTILIVSVTEKQAEEMLIKVLLHLNEHYKGFIKKGKDRPTKHTIRLANGSVIRCEPIGQTGIGVLGFTVDLIIADEAAFMPEAVWNVLTPMLFTTGGNIILVSTPNTKEGYFWNAYSNPESNFKIFHVNSEEVEAGRPDPQQSRMRQQRLKDKARMTTAEYGRWYLAKFQDEFNRFFSDYWIENVCQAVPQNPEGGRKYYLGMDIGAMGDDPSTYEILDCTDSEKIVQTYHEITNKTSTDEVVDKAQHLDRKWNFKQIYIDDGGVGFGVWSYLSKTGSTKQKTTAINNASRAINRDEKMKITRKEELYNNLKALGQQKQIKLLANDEIIESLRSVVMEIDPETKKRKIHGKNTHIVEGLIRAAWASQEKHLNLWVRWSSHGVRG